MTGDALEAVLLAGLASNTLKSVSGRPRPVHGLGSESWGVGAASFPSGEVTQAFAIASVFARHSQRRWIDAVAWSYAGLITWERMNLDAHWASDSLAGAIIGTAGGRWVVRRNGRYAGERPLIVPIVGESEWGLVGNFRVGR